MSIRTIIEINHDALDDLRGHESEIVDALMQTKINASLNQGLCPQIAPGVRVLMQRHHTDEVTLQSNWRKIEL